MTECTNIDLQEQLPELVAGVLRGAMRTDVEVHLASCAACRAELDLLDAVRRVRPQPAPLDIERIVAALPRPGSVSTPEQADADARPFRVITGGEAGTRTLRQSPHRSTAPLSVTRRSRDGCRVRFVARALRRRVHPRGRRRALPRRRRSQPRVAHRHAGGHRFRDHVRCVPAGAIPDDAPQDEPYAPGAVLVQPVVSVAPAVLPLQELSDYTDDELALLLERLDAWDGAPRVDSVGLTTAMRESDLREEL